MKTPLKNPLYILPLLLILEGPVLAQRVSAQKITPLPFNGIMASNSLVVTRDGQYIARDSNWIGQLIVLDRKTKRIRSWHPAATNDGDVGAKGLIQLGATPFVAGTADFNGASRNSVGIYDLRTGNLRVIARGQTNKRSLVSTPDGRTIVTPYLKGGLAFWDVKTGRLAKNWKQFGQGDTAPDALAVSPNGKQIATGHYYMLYGADAKRSGTDGGQSPQIWEARTGRLVVTCQKVRHLPSGGGTGWSVIDFTSLVFSPNGRFLATGSNGNGIAVWDAVSGKTVHLLAHPQNRVGRSITYSWNGSGIAFSPDSKRIAAPGNYGTIDVYSLQNGKLLKQIKGGGPLAWTREGLFFNGSQPRRPEGQLMLLKL